MHTWQLQQAKARLSELVRLTGTEGPQEISVRGERAVVVLSREDYDKLVAPKPPLTAFLRKSPLAEVADEMELDRDRSPSRDVAL